MTQRILIDAVHPEEVRVVLAQDNRLEEFDFETAAKKQIKGNIYLGKITRVEPSLQAAFVEYGGARQGFLPFAEVHYDYYQIPTEDRDKIAEILDKERAKREEASSEQEDKTMSARTPKDPTTTVDDDKPKKVRKTPARKTAVKKRGKAADAEAPKEAAEEVAAPVEAKPVEAKSEKKKALVDEAARRKAEELERAFAEEFGGETAAKEAPAAVEGTAPAEEGAARPEGARQNNRGGRRDRHGRRRGRGRGEEGSEGGESARGQSSGRPERTDDEEGGEKNGEHEELGGDDFEEARSQRSQIFRNYKIQEVLKRNQIVLVQVIKEERGNKGASLTTYISLAGRYSVLMPNTDRGGGISRRITDIQMRKALKSLLTGMNMPKGASVIIRTAGMDREVEEIRHDFNYLLELWETIRQRAVKAVAPAMIHEEGNLIKRALRDMFRHTVTDVVVEGTNGYLAAKECMEVMAPESLSKLKEYKGSEPLFRHYGIDTQLDDLYDNSARLPSGGALVITPTEALVSIDVNSGRSTRERSIEDTALKTNIEAAEEIARQLRLRDLAGLVVIDFIDMRELRNRRAVEGALKRALKTDRARIQVGRISPFGLLEMSRQRMRSSIVESSTVPCTTCGGTGFVRSDESTALKLLRVIEAEAMKGQPEVAIRTATSAAFYLLNNKREELSAIERTNGIKILVDHDHTLHGAEYSLDRQRGGAQAPRRKDERDERGGRDRGGRDRDRGRDRGGRDRDNNRDRNRDNRDNNRDRNEQPAPAEAADAPIEEQEGPQPMQNERREENPHHRGGQGQGQNRDGGRDGRGRRRGRNRQGGGEHRHGGGQGQHQNRQPGQHIGQNGGQHAGQNMGLPQDEPESFPKSENVAEFVAHDGGQVQSGGEGEDDKDSSRLRGLWKKITQ